MKEFFDKLGAWFRGIIEFLKLTRQELHNVSWPSRREVTGTTLIVIVAVFFFGFFLALVDAAVTYGQHLYRAIMARS
jgi:preprotein translocase SecE subunit